MAETHYQPELAGLTLFCFVLFWTSSSPIGKDEYFSCGLKESIHNIVIITEMTVGNWKSGYHLCLPQIFIMGLVVVRDGGMNFMIFSPHFSR